MFRTKTNHRETKSGITAEAGRARRIGASNSLRRNDREEMLNSRRKGNEQAPVTTGDDADVIQDIPNIPTIIDNLNSPDEEVVKDSVVRIRHLVSLANDPPFDDIIQLGGVPKLVSMLNYPNDRVVFEAAWCLTNFASGSADQTRMVVESGAIPPLIALLDHGDDEIRDQAVWALGNIAGEHSRYRDEILSLGAMQKLIELSHRAIRLCMLRNISWTMSNFCRGKDPQPDFEIVKLAIPTLQNMLVFRDDDIVSDAAWALSFISDEIDDNGEANIKNHKIEIIVHAGVLPRLVSLLSHPNPNIKTPALRTIGNIVTGNHFQTQMVLNVNVLPPLISLLSNPRRALRREAAWALSNIAAGTPQQVRLLLENNAFHLLIKALATADLPVKKEIAWVICNACSTQDEAIINHIGHIGWVPTLVDLLREQDHDLQSCVLETLRHILTFGENHKQTKNIDGTILDVNIFAETLERSHGVGVIHKCLSSDSNAVYEAAHKLLVKFLGFETDEKVDPLAEGMDAAANDAAANPFATTNTLAFNNEDFDGGFNF